MSKRKGFGILLALALLLAVPLAGFSTTTTCNINGICSGSLHATSDVLILPLQTGTATVYISVTGTWTGTLTFNQSGNGGASYVNSSCVPQPSGAQVTSTTANGQWRCLGSGLTNFEVLGTSVASGTAIVRINSSPASAAETIPGAGGPPSGSAGGDLAGTYPDPTVAGANGAPIPASEPCVGTNSLSQFIVAPCALKGTTSAIGGSALTAGQQATGTVTIVGASAAVAAGRAMNVTPVTQGAPGDGFIWSANLTATDTVTVKVICNVAGTPTSTAYNVSF